MNSINGTYDQTLDGTDKMTLAWKNMQMMLAELGEAIGNTLAPIMEKITTVIQGITEWFSNLDEGTKETIVTIGLIVAAIGPLLVVGGKVMKGISSITGALSAMGSTSAGPIGLAIAAVAALVAAGTALVKSWEDAYAASSPYTEALNEIKTANDDLAESIKSTRDNYESAVTSSEANGAAAQALYEKLLSLIAAYSGTAEEQLLIEGIIEEMNALVPGLGLAWDEVTNSLNLTNAEIETSIELMKQQAQVAAAQQMYIEAVENQVQAEKTQKQALETLKAQMSDYGITMEELTAAVDDNYISNLEWLNMTRFGILEAGEAYGAWKQFNEVLGEYGEACENSAKAAEDFTYADELFTEAIQNTKQTTEEATVTIQSMYQNTFGTVIPAALNTSIVAAQNAGIQIPDTLVKGLEDGQIAEQSAIDRMNALVNFQTAIEAAGLGGLDVSQSFVDSWLSGEYSWTDANNYLNGLVEFTQAIQAAQEGGVELTAEFVNGLLSDAGLSSVISAADQLGETAKPTIVANDIQTVGAAVPENLSEGMAAAEGTATATAAQIASDIEGEFDLLPGDMNTSGSDAGSNLESGFAGWKGTVSGTVDDMYKFFYNSLGTTLPSMMNQWGSNAGQKFNSGIKIWISDIQTTATNIRTYIQNGVQGLPGYMAQIGNQAGQGLYNGLGAWQGSLSSLAWSIANSINAAARRALQIRSPSKIMQEVGEYTGEGLEIGLEESGKGILDTAEGIISTLTDTLGTTNLRTGLEALNSGVYASVQTKAARTESADSTIAAVIDMLTQYLPYLAADKDIHFDDGTWAGVLAPSINQELEVMRARSARG
jgi:hypothetical protein